MSGSIGRCCIFAWLVSLVCQGVFVKLMQLFSLFYFDEFFYCVAVLDCEIGSHCSLRIPWHDCAELGGHSVGPPHFGIIDHPIGFACCVYQVCQ